MLSVDSVGLPSFHSLEELAKRQGLRGRDHVGEKIHPNDGQFCILATQAQALNDCLDSCLTYHVVSLPERTLLK